MYVVFCVVDYSTWSDGLSLPSFLSCHFLGTTMDPLVLGGVYDFSSNGAHEKGGGDFQQDSLETKLLFSQGYEEGLFRIFTCRSSKGTCVCLHLLWTQKLFLSFTAGLWMILDGDLECKIASIFALNGIVCWHIYLWRKKKLWKSEYEPFDFQLVWSFVHCNNWAGRDVCVHHCYSKQKGRPPIHFLIVNSKLCEFDWYFQFINLLTMILISCIFVVINMARDIWPGLRETGGHVERWH